MHAPCRIATLVLLLACCVRTALAVDTFAPTGSLAVGRYGANAGLLANGRVLIAGGRAGPGTTTTAEIYDSSTGTFTATGNMVSDLLFRASAPLPAGRVLFVCGLLASDGSYFGTNVAEVYDPSSGTFAATGNLAAVGNSVGRRWLTTAVALADGKVLVTGGTSHTVTLSDAQVYDPALGTFAVTGNMVTARVAHTATLLPDGKILIAGGSDPTLGGTLYKSAEIYDPSTGAFSATGEMISHLIGRYSATATLLANGTVLIAGGQDADGNLLASAEIFDESSGSFAATGDLNTVRLAATASILADGKVLIAGGSDPANTDNSIASAEIYDPATGTFSAAANMANARQDATATALPGGRVLIAGGDDLDGIPLSSAEIYIANVIFHAAFEAP